MFIKFNNKLVNTSKVDVINITEQSSKFDVSMVFPDESFVRESFSTQPEADKRFAELENMLCNPPSIIDEIIYKTNTRELYINVNNTY